MIRTPEVFLLGVELPGGGCAVCQFVTLEHPPTPDSKPKRREPTAENIEAYLTKTFGQWVRWIPLLEEDYFGRDRASRKDWKLGARGIEDKKK